MTVRFRHIVVLMMTTVMICSCERDVRQDIPEPVPVPETGTPITFMASQQQETAVTRATTPLQEYQTTFRVWGFKNYSYNENGNGDGSYGDVQTVFQDYTVQYYEGSQLSTTSNSAGWEYILADYPDQSIKFWDWSARAYRFFGVTGEAGGTRAGGVFTVSLQADTLRVAEPTFYTRLWFSDGNPTTYPTRQFGKTVQLEFLKPYAKVRFLFIPADETVNLENLVVEDPVFAPANEGQGITLKGTFSVSYPLEGTATRETWTVERSSESGSSMSAFTKDERWYTVLPVQGQGAFKLTVTVAGDPDKECIVPAEYMNWLPCYQYTYIFKVNDEGGIDLGEVKSAYTDWKLGAEAERRIFNW